jgi:hypothetical protein
MTLLRVMCRNVWIVLLSAACWAALVGSALAGEPTKDKEAAGASVWALPYMLVVLVLALGLLTVLKPTRRRERDKPEQYGE